jgi:putative tricarboxylic transport membrane protein
MRKYDLISGLFLLGVSSGTCIMAYRLGFDDIHNPGPGLIPFGVAALLGLMSAGLSVRSLVEATRGDQEKDVFEGIAWKKIIIALCGLLGYGIFFNFLGFRISTFLLMILFLGAVSRMKWRWALLTSLITVVCAYLIFVVWLGCPFPTGPFGI